MKASELRIGNVTTLGVVYLIDQDVFRVINSEGISFKNTWANIEPIQLTEEWLLKFGFSCDTKIGGDKIEFRVYTLGAFTYNTNHLWWYRHLHLIGVQLDYLHQLQNLYFALTGEELTFKQEEQNEKQT